MFGNGIKHHTVKRRTNEKPNFLNFIIWNIEFFSLFPLASASVAPFVNETYESQEDLYDAILNTFFPIFFVVLLNVSGKPGSIKHVVLPIIDDILYNMITWVIPLIVSFVYDDLMSIKIFSIINMCLHVICAAIALIRWKRVVDAYDDDDESYYLSFYFLVIFPVIVIPIFWIIILTHKHAFDSISIIFLILFGICLVSFMLLIMLTVVTCNDIYKQYESVVDNSIVVVGMICFYAPNILQTLLIALSWPINVYFVKACVFILVLSLTRNVSYFTDKVPGDLLATSTTTAQCYIKGSTKDGWQKIFKETQISIEERQKNMQTTIDEMQKNMQTTIDEMQKNMQTTMNEMKISMDEMKKNQPND
jgi:hypothetical protein